jgi:hypothetical protein
MEKKTWTISEMAKLEPLSDEWFEAAFEDCIASSTVKRAAKRICKAFEITGQADPAYIANVIEQEIKYKLV